MAISFVTNLPAKTHTNHTCKRKCATTERHAAKWLSTDISDCNLPASNPREPWANPGEMG